jgi:hypothetical protein
MSGSYCARQSLDRLLPGRDPKEFFKDSLFDELKKALAERVLNAEICGVGRGGEERSSDAFKLCPLAGGRAAPSQPGQRTRFYVRLNVPPKAKVRRRDIGDEVRMAGKIALFVDLRPESSSPAPCRGLLSAVVAPDFDPVGEGKINIVCHSSQIGYTLIYIVIFPELKWV